MHSAMGQNGTEQKNRIVVIIFLMLYNDARRSFALKLMRKQIYITPTQASAIKRLAREQKTSESAILRKALEQFLMREGIMEMQDPFADLIAMFEGPVQVNHDDIY